MGLEGVRRSPWSSFGGVDGLDDDTSIIVGVDVDSEGLREVTLFVSENVPPAGLWFDIGRALACSAWMQSQVGQFHFLQHFMHYMLCHTVDSLFMLQTTINLKTQRIHHLHICSPLEIAHVRSYREY